MMELSPMPRLSPHIEIHPIGTGKVLIHQTEFDKRIVVTRRIYELIQELDQTDDPRAAMEELGIADAELEELYSRLADYGIVDSDKPVTKIHPAHYLHVRA